MRKKKKILSDEQIAKLKELIKEIDKPKPKAKPRLKPKAKPRLKPRSKPRLKPRLKPRSKPKAKPKAKPRPKAIELKKELNNIYDLLKWRRKLYELDKGRNIEELRNKHPKSNVLIVGSGPSAKKVFNNQEKYRKQYDVVIVSNEAIMHLEEIADYWVVMEQIPSVSKPWITHEASCSLIGNIVNSFRNNGNWYGSLLLFEEQLVDWRTSEFSELNIFGGLLCGPQYKGQPIGTVMLQMMHFACILGAINIDIIGCELSFPEDREHFYEDSWYSDTVGTTAPFSEFIYIEKDGKLLKTFEYFIESANYIKKYIKEIEEKNIAKVNILCDSLINRDSNDWTLFE